ncbi:MogA/MoaB family molybdenum cofactor biosynthesis protein [Gordonia liuliyuniae]|uniref:MogA/MoaB family molybdenum cofactor biosynthesis protein n=1 Tax=Gordonia liuliyuniae TaxID=2911517 RepID=A0ABS9IQ41_9ACTN|nr:MogA/MoaB family molybdenum cofactor biosynthesis protein [Gordonia liuliyuniae]MCF8587671.1 MogA/MoaB family molybdenum cofactor biosynthesis protein [Gordonia liuliyuniae]
MQHPVPRHLKAATVITVSDRCAAGAAVDRSGPLAAEQLADAGWHADQLLVRDEVADIAGAIRAAVDAGSRLVVTTGGTGIAARDVTPEATGPLLDRELPGIADAVRAVGVAQLPQAMLSRGLAGTLGSSLIVNLAGSTGAVRDGLPVILTIAEHVVSQLDGGDHT